MIFTWVSDFCASHESFFAFNLKCLYYVGLWPEKHLSKNQLFLYKIYEITLHIFSLIYLIITSIGTYNQKDDLILFLTNLDFCLVSYNFVPKVIFFVLRRKQLKTLITEIESSGDKISEERKQLMCHHVIIITVVCTVTAGVFSGIAQYKGEMTVEAWMPFDPKKNKVNLALSAQLTAIIFVVPCLYRSFAMQGIICSIIMYLRDQLIELQDRLRALDYSPENEKAIREEFKEIVRKHVRLMGYAKTMSSIFKEYFLVQNLVVTAELCLNAMMVTIVGFTEMTLLASFFIFLGIALLNAYIYCYLGNELIIQSEGIALAAYEADWTPWPVDLQKDLLKVITAAQKSLQLSAGGLSVMSIQTFGQALANGYSIFAVLNDAVD